ncbi:MutS-related protein [Maribellus mangrovi]|uniref:MutS-related protein n=1 Tax=Maribellus mangrovi TaxID=3133146 RepID=UPI0030EC7265
MRTPENFYQNKFDEYSGQLQSLRSKLRWFGWYRFLAFVFIFLPFFFDGFNWRSIIYVVLLVALFFYLIKKNIQLEREKRRTGVLLKLVEDERLALQHSFLHFPDGKEFLDTDHFYSYDLDLFGSGSLFQFINRTSTLSGKNLLAKWLMFPFKNKKEIEPRQHAVKELAAQPEWRLEFLSAGKLFEETADIYHEIRSWSELNLKLKKAAVIRYLIWVVPAITLISAVPAILGITNLFLILTLFAQWIMLYFFWTPVTKYFGFFGRKSELLSKYMQQLGKIGEHEFQSVLLLKLQQRIEDPSAAKAFKKLKSLVKEFDYRENLLVGLAMNSFLLWDIRCMYRLWQWHQKYHKDLGVWLDVVAEVDALVSLANFSNNHPEFVFPQVQVDDFEFSSTQLGHPLLHPDKRICNDLSLNKWSQVLIVTGANMAGKSTFLRTVGVNLVLAKMGAPVCASSMRFTPIDIYTNMRTTDSLLKDESYFFAELSRIKTVLDRLKNGERYFVILDEMLKGTNSIDKLNGSKELIRRLVHLQAVSLIATHDLKLSEMEKEYPVQVSNKCFEISIENDELVFDYKLSGGVTKTMNATFLMKKMGII